MRKTCLLYHNIEFKLWLIETLIIGITRWSQRVGVKLKMFSYFVTFSIPLIHFPIYTEAKWWHWFLCANEYLSHFCSHIAICNHRCVKFTDFGLQQILESCSSLQSLNLYALSRYLVESLHKFEICFLAVYWFITYPFFQLHWWSLQENITFSPSWILGSMWCPGNI